MSDYIEEGIVPTLSLSTSTHTHTHTHTHKIVISPTPPGCSYTHTHTHTHIHTHTHLIQLPAAALPSIFHKHGIHSVKEPVWMSEKMINYGEVSV
jgi:hypothetical protein